VSERDVMAGGAIDLDEIATPEIFDPAPDKEAVPRLLLVVLMVCHTDRSARRLCLHGQGKERDSASRVRHSGQRIREPGNPRKSVRDFVEKPSLHLRGRMQIEQDDDAFL
jgi:hypothetical protein